MRLISKRLIPLIILLGAARSAEAQTFELTPFVGGFVPVGTLGSVRVPALQGGSVIVKGEMVASAIFGARLAARSKNRLGLEATYFTASPGMRIVFGGFNQTFDAKVNGGSLKLTYLATSEQSGTDLVLTLGASGVGHSGKAFAIDGSTFDFGGAAGGGLRIAMSPNVTLRFDGDLLVYQFQSGPGLNPKWQQDLVMSAGLGLKLNR